MILRIAVLFIAAVALGACAKSQRPIDPHQISSPDEMKPGRGVFSGDDGEFTLKL